MRALSFTEPWGTLVANNHKRYETRGWKPTKIPEVIAIHASKGFPTWAKRLCKDEPFNSRLQQSGMSEAEDFHLGKIIAVTKIVEWQCTHDIIDSLSALECSFGDYSSGRFAWKFEDTVKLRLPISCKGSLSLWQIPDHTKIAIHEQLSGMGYSPYDLDMNRIVAVP